MAKVRLPWTTESNYCRVETGLFMKRESQSRFRLQHAMMMIKPDEKLQWAVIRSTAGKKLVWYGPCQELSGDDPVATADWL